MFQVLKHGEVLCIMEERADSATGAPVVVIFPYKSGSGNCSLSINFFDMWNQEPIR